MIKKNEFLSYGKQNITKDDIRNVINNALDNINDAFDLLKTGNAGRIIIKIGEED